MVDGPSAIPSWIVPFEEGKERTMTTLEDLVSDVSDGQDDDTFPQPPPLGDDADGNVNVEEEEPLLPTTGRLTVSATEESGTSP